MKVIARVVRERPVPFVSAAVPWLTPRFVLDHERRIDAVSTNVAAGMLAGWIDRSRCCRATAEPYVGWSDSHAIEVASGMYDGRLTGR